MIQTYYGVVVDASVVADPRREQPFSVPAGETSSVPVAVVHLDGSPFNLTGCQLLFTVTRDGAIFISRQATIDSVSLGTAHFPLVVADTLALLGKYDCDIWLTDGSGNRWAVVKTSPFRVTAAQGQPGQTVTVPASQTPLALGPQGPYGIFAAHDESGYAAISVGYGNGHEYLDVTFAQAFSAATGATAFRTIVELYVSGGVGATWWIENRTTTGMRIVFSGTFDGEVRWRAYQ